LTGLRPIARGAAARVLPSREETARLKELADFLLSRTQSSAAKHPEVKDVTLGGSYAKGTWLTGHVDIDIFVQFDPSTPDGVFERLGLAIGAETTRGFPRGKKYAQHPYIEATVRGVRVNIVPCFAVQERKWKSAADRSPFHVELVERLSEEQKTQIRLLKRLMLAIGVYGAEIEVQGFSGYAAEVLVIEHGDFEGVLRHFAEIKPDAGGVLFRLPDPVDPTRDLARAISMERLGRLVLASREFLRRPTPALFSSVHGPGRAATKARVVALVFSHARISEDTLWGELRRTLKHIVRVLEERGFRIARSMAASNNAERSAFLLIPESDSLPSLEQRVGPTVDRRKEIESFLSTNRKRAKLVWVDEEARVRFFQDRHYTDISSLLRDISAGRIEGLGASREVGRGMARSGRVATGAFLMRLASSRPWLKDGVREIASDTFGTRSA